MAFSYHMWIHGAQDVQSGNLQLTNCLIMGSNAGEDTTGEIYMRKEHCSYKLQ